jgi:polygalacturonase
LAQVTFQGHTTWAYAEWEGSLFSISGNNITIKGAPGHVLDGQGHLWWDTLGGGGGVTKPKFFKANNLNDSVLDSINVQNAPKNFFSINYVNNLLVTDVICNNTAGDELQDGKTLGHNTDAFDINNADGVVIQNARVFNQDDCVAVNSGQNVLFKDGLCSGGRKHHSSHVTDPLLSCSTLKCSRMQHFRICSRTNGILRRGLHRLCWRTHQQHCSKHHL